MKAYVTVASLNGSFTDTWTLTDLPDWLSPDEVMAEAVHEMDRVYGFQSDLYIAELIQY